MSDLLYAQAARRLNISRAVHFLRSKVCEITISGVGSDGGVVADSESVFYYVTDMLLRMGDSAV